MKTKQLCFLLYLLFLTTFVFSQNIKVFFNQSVDNTISLSTDAFTSNQQPQSSPPEEPAPLLPLNS